METINIKKIIKIIFFIIAILIFFDKLFILLTLSLYFVIQKFIFKKNIENPLTLIKNKINPQKRVNSYLDNTFFKNNQYLLTEKFTNFEPSGNIAANLGNIFKNSNMNFNAYPNVEINTDKPLFNNNKFLPECCLYNSEYSTDKGCPCITPDQQYYLHRRGTNKHKDDLFTSKSDNYYKNIFFSPSLGLKGDKFPFLENNVNYKIKPEPQTDISKNEFYELTNNLSYEFIYENPSK